MGYNNYDFLKVGYKGNYGNSDTIYLRGKSHGTLMNKHNITLLDKRFTEENLTAHTVYSLHVTRDVLLENTDKLLMSLTRTPFANHIVKPYKCSSTTGKVQSVVIMSKYRNTRPGRSVYLTIYDKYAESKLIQFSGVCRIELKITTFKEIRSKLGIFENDLKSVLESKCNPIDLVLKKLYNKICCNNKDDLTAMNFNHRLYEAYFVKFGNDFYQIESDMKASGCSPFKIRKALKIYTEIMTLREGMDYKDVFRVLLNAA